MIDRQQNNQGSLDQGLIDMEVMDTMTQLHGDTTGYNTLRLTAFCI